MDTVTFTEREPSKHRCAFPGCTNPVAGWASVRRIGIRNFCKKHLDWLTGQRDANEALIGYSYDPAGREEKNESDTD